MVIQKRNPSNAGKANPKKLVSSLKMFGFGVVSHPQHLLRTRLNWRTLPTNLSILELPPREKSLEKNASKPRSNGKLPKSNKKKSSAKRDVMTWNDKLPRNHIKASETKQQKSMRSWRPMLVIRSIWMAVTDLKRDFPAKPPTNSIKIQVLMTMSRISSLVFSKKWALLGLGRMFWRS